MQKWVWSKHVVHQGGWQGEALKWCYGLARHLFSSLCFVSGITGRYKSKDARFPVPLSVWERNSFGEETPFWEERGKGMNLAASYADFLWCFFLCLCCPRASRTHGQCEMPKAGYRYLLRPPSQLDHCPAFTTDFLISRKTQQEETFIFLAFCPVIQLIKTIPNAVPACNFKTQIIYYLYILFM